MVSNTVQTRIFSGSSFISCFKFISITARVLFHPQFTYMIIPCILSYFAYIVEQDSRSEKFKYIIQEPSGRVVRSRLSLLLLNLLSNFKPVLFPGLHSSLLLPRGEGGS